MQPNSKKRILIVDPEGSNGRLLRTIFEKDGYEVSQSGSGDAAYQDILSNPPDLVIADVALPGMDGYALCRQLHNNRLTHALPMILIVSRDESSDKIAAFEAGADDCMAKPIVPLELLYRARRFLARPLPVAVPSVQVYPQGRTIAVCSNKGGVGKTTVSINLAVALQRQTRKSVAVFDADFFCGNVGTYLNLPSVRSIADLIPYADDLDPELVDQVLTRHSSGVRALLSPASPDQAIAIRPALVARLIELMAGMHSYTVVDCQTNLDERLLPVFEQATDILVITTPEMGSLKNMRSLLDHLVNLGIGLDRVTLVLNRADSDVKIDVKEIEQTFKQKVVFRLAGGGRSVPLSINAGIPLVEKEPNHPLSRQIVSLADFLRRTSPAMPVRLPMATPLSTAFA